LSRKCTCQKWEEEREDTLVENTPWSYCPWCGSILKMYGTLTKEENEIAFRGLVNSLHDKLAYHPEAGVRRVFVDREDKTKMWIELEHQVYKKRIDKYMIDKVEPITEHIDGKYHFKVWGPVTPDDIAVPHGSSISEDELEDLFKELDLDLGDVDMLGGFGEVR
jgi:hypothetical protein